MDQILAKCKKCGWMHFERTRKEAADEVKSFNEYLNTVDKKIQEEYYETTGTSIENYEQCFRCGNDYKNFIGPTLEDRWDQESLGQTIQPIIRKED